MSEYVYPNCRTVVAWQGSRVRLNPGQSWSADDPFVKERPELFDIDPRRVSRSEVPETTTRAPGETRTTPARKATRKAGPTAPKKIQGE